MTELQLSTAIEEILVARGCFEVAHSAHVDGQVEVRGAADIKDPGSNNVTAEGVTIVS